MLNCNLFSISHNDRNMPSCGIRSSSAKLSNTEPHGAYFCVMWRYFLIVKLLKFTNMSNLQGKIDKEYPIFDNKTSVSKTDEYDGNEIQFIKRSAFQNGYELCQKEYEEKIQWIPIEEKLPRKDKKRVESDFSIFVLVKDIHGIPQSAYYNFVKNGFYSNAFSKHEIMCVTHWRYIL